MPLCATGQSLYDSWTKYARFVEILEARRCGGLLTHLMEHVVISESYDEVYLKGMTAQTEFMRHRQYCDDCLESAFRK